MTAKFFQHPQALVESDHIGPGTRVWAFAHVLPGAKIGVDCNICDHTFLENNVVVGDRVTLKCGVQLWDGVRVEDDVFIGPNATFTNDPSPRSRQRPERFAVTTVRKWASIGANATILPGLTIGQYAMVGAGSVVTRDVPPYAVVVGNPARIIRYTDDVGSKLGAAAASTAQTAVANTKGLRVQGVSLHHAPIIQDMRGNLSAREVQKGIPFVPQRSFVVFDVPSKEVRGAHAHRKCHQLLTCLRGTLHCVVDDGRLRDEISLDGPETAVHIPPMVWGIQYKYSSDAVLLVLASDPYDAADYIRDYDQFLIERKQWERTHAGG